jgi:hypothetical protein
MRAECLVCLKDVSGALPDCFHCPYLPREDRLLNPIKTVCNRAERCSNNTLLCLGCFDFSQFTKKTTASLVF